MKKIFITNIKKFCVNVFNMLSNLITKIRRFFNKKTIYNYKPTNNGFLKFVKPIISENNNSFFDPCCIEINDRIFLYASNRNNNSIDLFILKNLIIEKHFVVLTSKENTREKTVNRCSVLEYKGKYYMYYTGQANDKSCIGIAVSNDGINFERLSITPILYPSFRFEKNSIMNPCVIFDTSDNMFRMWYSAGEIYEPDIICYATSLDGIRRNKHKEPVFEKGNFDYDKYKIGGCDVHKENESYVMWYIGYENLDNARICCAHSIDGIMWRRDDNNPIVSPTMKGWDCDACYKPSFYNDKRNNIAYIFYNGRNSGKESIGFVYKEID